MCPLLCQAAELLCAQPWHGSTLPFSDLSVLRMNKWFNERIKSKAELHFSFASAWLNCLKGTCHSRQTSLLIFLNKCHFGFRKKKCQQSGLVKYKESQFVAFVFTCTVCISSILTRLLEIRQLMTPNTTIKARKGRKILNIYIEATFSYDLSLIVSFAITEQTVKAAGRGE